MSEVLAEKLLQEKKPNKAQERTATQRLETIFRAKGVDPSSFGVFLRRMPATVFDDRNGIETETAAHDLMTRFLLHDARAEGMVADGVATQLARASLQREPSPNPSQPALPARPRREEAHAAVKALAREAGRLEEPLPTKTAPERRMEKDPVDPDNWDRPADNGRQQQQQPPPPPPPPPPPGGTRNQNNNTDSSEDSEGSDSQASSTNDSSDSEATHRSRATASRNRKEKRKAKRNKKYTGTFSNPGVLWEARCWNKEFEKGASIDDLRRELARQGRTQEQPQGYTKEVAELFSKVLLEMARNPGHTTKPSQLLLDALFRTKAFAEGTGKSELEALSAALDDEELPARLRAAKRTAKKEAKKDTLPRRTPLPREPRAPAPNRDDKTRAANRGEPNKRIDKAVWTSLSAEQRAAITKALRN